MLFDDDDPDGQKLMGAVKTWQERELKIWFDYNFIPYLDIDSMNRMFRASTLTGETDLVLGWLDRYYKKLPPRSLTAFNVQLARSIFLAQNVADAEAAKAVGRSVLAMQPEVDATSEEYFILSISDARLDLAGIIFAQFSSSDDPVRKQELVEEMKHLPGPKGGEGDFQESHIGMLYANMLRVMGPAVEYNKYMNEVFQACVKGLGDDDSYNDATSLRLLTKILSSLPGLETDARIALCAQFSVLDQGIHLKSMEAREAEESEESEQSEDEEAEDNAHDEVEIPDQMMVCAENPYQSDEGSDKDDGEVQPPGTSTSEREDAKVKIEEGDVADIQDVEVAEEGEKDDGNEESEENDDEDEEEEQEDDDDQDLIGEDAMLGCDECGEAVMLRWDQPFYLCLVCPNIDLCEPCHDKRRAAGQIAPPVGRSDSVHDNDSTEKNKATSEDAVTSELVTATDPPVNGVSKSQESEDAAKEETAGNEETENQTAIKTKPTEQKDNDEAEAIEATKVNGEQKDDEEEEEEEKKEERQWRTFCDPNHNFIRGPMKGWRGIKDGVIRIDGREDVTVKDWLKTLSEERWPAAWKRFWKGNGGLRDIGVES